MLPLLPDWSMALDLSSAVIDHACYDRAFHTLALEQLRYLRSLDRKAQLSSSDTCVNELQSELMTASA